jgi:tetratricopeptide (TPR) repeat protein
VVTGLRILAVVLLAVAAGGCAALRVGPLAPPPAVSAGTPSSDELAAPYRAQAEQLERDGRLRQAAEAWTTALSLAPAHEPSRQALRRLRQRIEREVAEHLRNGWQSVGHGSNAEARRYFLAALALDPTSRPAQEALRAVPAPAAQVPSPEPPRTVPGGVPPTGLASAEARLSPAPRPRPESMATRSSSTPDAQAGEAPAKPEALYAAARAHLEAGRQEAAYRELVHLARVSPGYRDSAALLDHLRPRLVRQRYQEGLRLFREELLEDAIAQWRGVLELDPKHAEARRSIEQTETMLRTLAAQSKR